MHRLRLLVWTLSLVTLVGTAARGQEAAPAAATALEQAVVREAEATVKAFNAGDAAALAGTFSEAGELVDEQGNVHSGRRAITELFTGFFATFPGAVLEMQPTSVRPVGDAMLVEEGERRITVPQAGGVAQVHYVG